MLAVVQIGSSTVRSPCMTARMVLAAGGADWAISRPGAAAAALAARPVCKNLRRDVVARRLIGILLGPAPSQARRHPFNRGRLNRPGRLTHACAAWARGGRVARRAPRAASGGEKIALSSTGAAPRPGVVAAELASPASSFLCAGAFASIAWARAP